MEAVESRELELKRNEIVTVAENFIVESDDQYQAAGALAIQIKGLMKEVNDTFEPIKKKQYGAWKETCNQMNKFMKPLESAESVIKAKIKKYVMAIEAKRREEERLAAEKKRQEEEALRQLASECGETPELTELAQTITDPVLTVEKPKTEGISVAETWDYKSSGEPLDPKYTMLDDKGFVVPDHAKIRKVVQALKADTCIAGVSVFSVQHVRVKAVA